MPLQLRYVFTPSPNPIRASVGGADPNKVDLQVMVSNPAPDPMPMKGISITIPVGQGRPDTLSDSPDLPKPEYDQKSGWKADAKGGTVTLSPPQGHVSDSFTFTLPGIVVNDKKGVVPLTITEVAPPPPNVHDQTTYELIKYEADFPITDFYVEPATLYDLDQTVTLKWECSDQGKDFVYRVHSDSWQPKECLDDNDCYSCGDGGRGVASPRLDQTTTFALDVIKAGAIYQTLYATARVLVPSVSQNSYLEPFLSNHLVRLHWLTTGASRCAVTLDGEVIADDAPADTYEQGFWVTLIPEREQNYQLSVTAYAPEGPARATHNFQALDIAPPAVIPLTSQPNAVAVTPDSKLALVAYDGDPTPAVKVFDLATLQSEDIPLPGQAAAMAVTPDGRLALVVGGAFEGGQPDTLWFVDVAGRRVAHTLQLDIDATDIAVTPDGKLAFVTLFNTDNKVWVVDIEGRKVVDTVTAESSPFSVAFTPDGRLALVTNYGSDTVTVIEVANRKVVDTIRVGNSPEGIAVTPDGKLALVASLQRAIVTVIDLATLKAEPEPIKIAGAPEIVFTSPDGAHAFIPDQWGNLTVIDIAERKARTTKIRDCQYFVGGAATPDGKHLVLACFNGRGGENALVII